MLKKKTGILYIAINQSLDEDIIKIGITYEDSVDKRMDSLSLSIPFQYDCIRAIRVSNAREVEAALQGVMKRRRHGQSKRKEFFKLNRGELEALHALLDAFRFDPMFDDVTPLDIQKKGVKDFLPASLKNTTFFRFSKSKMRVTNGRKWITKGSKIRKERTRTFEDQDSRRSSILSKIVNDALKDGIIADNGDEYYNVIKDWEFDRAYIAATIVSGRWCNNREWKEINTKEDYASWKYKGSAKSS